eukprot:gnl/MRDRNA2_/MRDRNA2_80233_c0_seq1.p1 gnl/MRDRNA2_/MRDRNA2_80233_c0~~gnl/MRDRNA2_/MRDRNA2_80233_c0_seq1.p1  ORF type:complete len:189 (-),score=25.76 gnl/MRDRNA2_/MRDRNA2_80233_c0_seq1:73-561(-)
MTTSLGSTGPQSPANSLRPATAAEFEYKRPRAAYGTVSSNLPQLHHRWAKTDKEYVEETRRRWYSAYATDCEKRSRSAAVAGSPKGRAFGGGGDTESSFSSWTWQSWRGWHATQRHLHEEKQRAIWADEGRERWAKVMPKDQWRSTVLKEILQQNAGEPMTS